MFSKEDDHRIIPYILHLINSTAIIIVFFKLRIFFITNAAYCPLGIGQFFE